MTKWSSCRINKTDQLGLMKTSMIARQMDQGKLVSMLTSGVLSATLIIKTDH